MTNELYHFGVKGMKWGVRRYQNKDGSLTPQGKKRKKIFDTAAARAKEFSRYAKESARMEGFSDDYKKKYGKQHVEIEKLGEEYYKKKAKKYSEIDITKVDKKTIKEAKNFIKKGYFAGADYTWYTYNGKERNYLYEEYKKDV